MADVREFPVCDIQFITNLAQAGFCCSENGTEAVCLSCKKRVKIQSLGSSPKDVHRRISPNCIFFTQESPAAPSTEANSTLQSSQQTGEVSKMDFDENLKVL